MRRLNQGFNGIVHVAVLDQGEAGYVEKVASARSMPLFTRMGLRYPAHCTGVGKVLLAHGPETVLGDISLVPFTPHTIIDPQVFRQELKCIRDVGVAYDREETLVGLSCVAAPIYDFTGEVMNPRMNPGACSRIHPGIHDLPCKIVDRRGNARQTDESFFAIIGDAYISDALKFLPEHLRINDGMRGERNE